MYLFIADLNVYLFFLTLFLCVSVPYIILLYFPINLKFFFFLLTFFATKNNISFAIEFNELLNPYTWFNLPLFFADLKEPLVDATNKKLHFKILTVLSCCKQHLNPVNLTIKILCVFCFIYLFIQVECIIMKPVVISGITNKFGQAAIVIEEEWFITQNSFHCHWGHITTLHTHIQWFSKCF